MLTLAGRNGTLRQKEQDDGRGLLLSCHQYNSQTRISLAHRFPASIPVGSAISEYVDVAHAFFDEREAKFVNGVLDAVAKTVR